MTKSKGIKIKPRGTISFKLGLFTAFLVFIFVMVTTVIIVRMNKIKLEEDLKNTGSSLALTLSSTSASAVISNDYLFLQGLPKMVSDEPDLLYLILVDDKNKCLVHTEEKFLDKLLKDKISQNALQFSKIKKPYIQEYYHQDSGYKAYDIATGIGIVGKKWATLRIGLSTRRLASAIKEIYLRSFILGFIVALFSFLISFLVSKKITSTILVFKDKLDQLQKDEKVEELTLKTGDEMEEIANSFNKVLKTWERLHDEVLKTYYMYADLVNNIKVGTYRRTPDGRFIEVNPALVLIVEADSKEDVILNHHARDTHQDPKKFDEINEKILKFGYIKDEEVELVTYKGRKFWASVAISANKDREGNICYDGVIYDITERKKMEEILIVSEERFRRLFEAAPDIIFRWNPETGIGYINPAVEIITGYTQKEIIGKMGFLLSKIHPEDMPRFMRELQSVGEKDGKIKSIEIRMIAKNGSIIWTEVRFVPIWDGQGNFLEIECIIRDISERKEAEEKLKATQEYARNLIDSSLDMIISVDPNRRIVEFNRAAQKMFGYSKAEVLGKSVDILYTGSQEGLKINEIARRTGQFTGEVVNKRKNGEVFPSFLAASALRDANGELVGVMGVSRDITERKRMEEELKDKIAELEKFTDVAVGRELKMAELKEEVNSLLEKLGQPKNHK